MIENNKYEKIQHLMESYVPEFSYSPGEDDPGSVLTDLCTDMVTDSEERFARVLPKHKIQYLNLFESLKKEPVSAARGYVQFLPVSGYEGDIMVPAATQVMCTTAKEGEIIFETLHDMSVTQAVPEMIIMTDKEKDCIVRIPYSQEKPTPWRAFDIEGDNQACHQMYLCFEGVFDYLRELDFSLYIKMRNEEEQKESLKLLASSKVSWSILDAEGKAHAFDEIIPGEEKIRFIKKDFIPQKYNLDNKEGYYLVAEVKEELPELYINHISLGFHREHIVPDDLFVNGISEPVGAVMPFGKPLQLYQEMSISAREVLSKKGAKITLDFDLDYVVHEENIEIPEADLEYKVIMKKPKKALEMHMVPVLADYVVWEYLSRTGWKQIWKEQHIAAMFNGSSEGHMRLEFICPEDMEDTPPEGTTGTVRVRLLRAENIYKVPAVYKCPRILNLQLSYSYEEEAQSADFALLRNSFEEQDVTRRLQQGTSIKAFYSKEHDRRSMYMGFSHSISGTPVSIYFDLENYNDIPIDFTVEYLSDRGFVTVKNIDGTDGFLGSGNMQLLIPRDMKKARLYGYEGYFLRFVNYNPQIKEYALPVIRGIYMNMAKVSNVNVLTEEFYLEDVEHDVDIQLSQDNLLQVQVWAKEGNGEQEKWVLWERSNDFSREVRTYRIDMLSGILHLDKRVLSNVDLSIQGPQFMVKHSNYSGAQANLAAGMIDTLRNSVRYISGVTNPFATYGGYDGYTEKSAQKLVNSMMYTRDRAVSAGDFFHIIQQTSFGVRKVKCASNVDMFGLPKPGTVTVAVLIDEYEKGMQIFSELKEEIRRKLLEVSSLVPAGKQLLVIQPHFIRVNVRLWLEKESMEQAYELQKQAECVIREFINPIDGGIGRNGWEIGDFPRVSQIVAYLRTRLESCEIAKIVMTADVDGTEVMVTESFYEKLKNPFVMAVNGEHTVYIDIA